MIELIKQYWRDWRRKKPYICPRDTWYKSGRYSKTVLVERGFPSDGATGALDVKNSRAWWVHDKLCKTGKWYDGSPVTNWQASVVLYDILQSEKRYIRAPLWLLATFLRGGGQARKNGMFKLKRKQR